MTVLIPWRRSFGMTHRGNLGGREIAALEKLRSEILNRLDPIAVEELERRASVLLDPMLAAPATSIGWSKSSHHELRRHDRDLVGRSGAVPNRPRRAKLIAMRPLPTP
jgi:hypothetical protein